MRILGFCKKWPKLQKPKFTTFRFPREDRDWGVGEVVQVVYKPRSKGREYLGNAQIIKVEVNHMEAISDTEAQIDGFKDARDMNIWFQNTYGNDDRWFFHYPMNKLTLRWVSG